MEYGDIIRVLLNEFPELQQRYDEDKFYLENLPHLVFEIIFVPYIKDILSNANRKDKINKAFELIENMINCTDEKVQEVAIVSVLEPLVSEREIVSMIKINGGVKTAALLSKMEDYFGWWPNG